MLTDKQAMGIAGQQAALEAATNPQPPPPVVQPGQPKAVAPIQAKEKQS
jgi:hypothetical protein